MGGGEVREQASRGPWKNPRGHGESSNFTLSVTQGYENMRQVILCWSLGEISRPRTRRPEGSPLSVVISSL